MITVSIHLPSMVIGAALLIVFALAASAMLEFFDGPSFRGW